MNVAEERLFPTPYQRHKCYKKIPPVQISEQLVAREGKI